MREVRIVTTDRKTTIPIDQIRRSAEIAYAKIREKEKKNGTGKKKKKDTGS